MISIITPTGDRPLALTYLSEYIGRQTFTGPVQWCVVDDGETPFKPPAPANVEMDYFRRHEPGVPGGSLNRNLIVGLRRAKHAKVVVMEDDDWYAPTYLDMMSLALNFYPIVGESRARYYNVRNRRWYLPHNINHASLAQTGWRREMLHDIDQCCRKGTPFIDLHIWKLDKPKHLFHNAGLCVGIKGMPGRKGLGQGGHQTGSKYTADPELKRLEGWIAEDVERYRQFGERTHTKSVVSQSWFKWLKEQPAEPPWCIIGKGPTFDQRPKFDLAKYRTIGLNHVCRVIDVDFAHIIDLECIEQLSEGDRLGNEKIKLIMPWHPHRDHKSQRETLVDLCASNEYIKGISDRGQLYHYHLEWAEEFGSRPSDEPVVGVVNYSVHPAVNLVIGSGLHGIFTLGIDGGKRRAEVFDDPPGVAQRVGYDRQFPELERIARVNKAAIWPLTGPPLNGSHREAIKRLEKWRE